MAQAADFPREIEVVTFSAGGASCALESRFVRGMRREGSREGSVPACGFFGMPSEKIKLESTSAARQSLLDLRLNEETEVSIEVGEPVALRTLSWRDIHRLPPLVAARCAIYGLRALAVDGESVLLVLDPFVAAGRATAAPTGC